MTRRLLSIRWIRVLAGLLVGATVGFTVYAAGQLKGPALFTLAGAAGGVTAALVTQLYIGNVRLTDITLNVPQFSELHFAVTRGSQQVAWKLFVEAVTRISTQSLAPGDGLIREALTSLYGLFAITREILKETYPSTKTGADPTVEHLAIAMLNNELRPFLSHWHPILLRWESENPDKSEDGWPYIEECRAELVQMQSRLQDYVLGFGRLAGLPNASEIHDGILGTTPSRSDGEHSARATRLSS